MKEYSDIFKCENGIGSEELCSDEMAQLFMDFLSIEEKQCEVVCAKTVHQGNSQFWIDQQAGLIMAFSFYKICHMKESADKTNTIN